MRFLAGWALLVATSGGALVACGPSGAAGDVDAGDGIDAGRGIDARAEGGPTTLGAIGSACIPSSERSASFAGFSEAAVTVDQGDPACVSGVCLVNHFRGRASCPYGQDKNANPPPPATGCVVPGTIAPVRPNDPIAGQAVAAQCLDRQAAKTVLCSCRCANADGGTDDGNPYCACPSGYGCEQVVPQVVAGDLLAGGYCIPSGTAYDRANACSALCDPTQGTCPTPDSRLAIGDGGAATYLTAAVRVQNGLCSFALPTNASGQAKCQVFYILAAADTCAAHGGLLSADARVAETIRTLTSTGASQAVCVLAQLAPAPCASSALPGWCYLTGAAAPGTCVQAINFSPSGMLPTGALAALACP